jgi:hypothetical protein
VQDKEVVDREKRDELGLEWERAVGVAILLLQDARHR